MIQVDDEVWAELQKRAVPLDDKEANDVLRREFGLKGHSNGGARLAASTSQPGFSNRSRRSRRSRLPRGERTPEESFFVPVLEAVVELGGRARVQHVLDRVEPKVNSFLLAADFELLSTGQIRWRNTAQWARNTMTNTMFPPLLNPDSDHGWWEITDAGRKYLKSHGS